MNYYRILFLIVLSQTFYSFQSYAQGCSDAGVCSIDPVKNNDDLNFDLNRYTLKVGSTYGVGEYDIKYINPYTEFTANVSKKIMLSAKLSYSYINGELAKSNGFSDIFVSSLYNYYSSNKLNSSFILGLKVPLSNSNLQENNASLPLHYQSSLGTYDIILGLNIQYTRINLNIALQQPVLNQNENQFLSPDDTSLSESKYISTNEYNRKGDVMSRISYRINVFNKVHIKPAVLAIYHLNNDSYFNDANKEVVIDGSKGLTLNGNLFLNYHITDRKLLEVSFGFPFVTRTARPDGLTREFVIGLEYSYSF